MITTTGHPVMPALRTIALALVLGACTSTGPSLEGQVNRIHTLDLSPRSFVIVADQAQRASPEFGTYADLVSKELRNHLWTEASVDSADVSVFLQYHISKGRQVSFGTPIFGDVPTGNVLATGPLNMNMAMNNAATTQQSTLGVVGRDVATRTVFDCELKIRMFSLATYRTKQKVEAVYEGEIRSAVAGADLPTFMPALIRGLFQGFPGVSGVVNTVSVTIRQ